MKTSVALASYNGEKYIIELLQSILNQSRPVDEVVITDDRSTDRTAELVENFIKDNKLEDAWSFSVNETNLGFAENFRRALDGATGDLVFPCDQDDVWPRERVEKMAGMMETHPEIELLNTDYASFKDGSDDLINYHEESSAPPTPISLNERTFFLQYPGCVMCARKSFYDETKRYWHKDWAHDDFLWGMALLRKTCYNWRYCSLKRRLHDNQTSGQVGHTRKKRIQYLSGVKQSGETFLEAAADMGAPEQTLELYRKNVTTHEYRLELVRDGKISRAVPLIRYLKYYYSKRSYLVELSLALKGGS